MSKRDYYEVLGISKSASADEIKKAFRRLAVKHHPDKEGGDEAKFKEINEAYEVLKDTSKRQRYDQFGHAGMGGNSGGQAGGNPFDGFQGFGQGQNINFDFGEGLGDLFGSFFGGGQNQQRQARGQDVAVNMTLSFEEAIFGAEKEFAVSINDVCSHCKGTTAEPGHSMKQCPQCKGSGQVNRAMNTVFGQIQQTIVCPNCNGRGQVPEKVCTVCHGEGTEHRRETVKLKVPSGVDDGATIRLSGRGEAVAHGQKGDLYVNLRVKPHKKFTREGNLILSDEHISMVDATLGTEIEIETVDGPLTMRIPPGTQSGTDFKLSAHGVPNLRGSGRGAHIVTMHVDIPTKLSKRQQELLLEFKASNKRNFFK